ncbi:TlpA disulfide reductase family protein [Sinomicrobium soli]|uniref:TlpA disulfide reductase family protein n=1 Tax=Sinomicrobium sp. N-1-3-6 TaxID=2219864 RepID=UPI000DCCB54F|nr:TlpA disulfide reductase family protein [Sinomicrobium sp. N-1-3-6]RAV29948.1 TlpA family protein disulfide reductase [Sinomicrobium sp. N-1-3-6]
MKWWNGIVFCMVLVACKTEKGGRESAVADNAVPEEGMPKRVIGTDDGRIGVYDFAGFEPWLYRGEDKIYVINFWATWCKPCVEELPYFERLSGKYDKDEVEVLLVSLDMPGTLEEQLLPFIRKKKLESRVIVLDDPRQNDWIPKVDPEWSGALPATLIYKGNNRVFHENSLTYEDLENQLTVFK